MKLKEVLDKSIQFFKDKKFETARLDAELLIAHALKVDRMQLYMKYEAPLSEREVSECREVVRRRSQGEPVAYITGEKGFYGLVFKVGAGVLIPRPETEDLVEHSINFIKTKKIESPRILDLGAGTGCIGFSILKNVSDATLVSVEKSEQAFPYLKLNCEALELAERAQLLVENVSTMDILKLGFFDIILANPPYIAVDDPETETMVKKFEPDTALFAEDKGYALLKAWSSKFASLLKTPGMMAFEMGYKQGPAMLQHFEQLRVFNNVEILKDLSGLDRIAKGVR